jgi:hypothetical protein
VLSTSIATISDWRIVVNWPWKEVDPSSQFAWDGTVAFPRDERSPEWLNTPWRFEDVVRDFNVGDEVPLWIPKAEFSVLSVETLEVPRAVGGRPRPRLEIELCHVDQIDDPEAGFVLYCDLRNRYQSVECSNNVTYRGRRRCGLVFDHVWL